MFYTWGRICVATRVVQVGFPRMYKVNSFYLKINMYFKHCYINGFRIFTLHKNEGEVLSIYFMVFNKIATNLLMLHLAYFIVIFIGLLP